MVCFNKVKHNANLALYLAFVRVWKEKETNKEFY